MVPFIVDVFRLLLLSPYLGLVTVLVRIGLLLAVEWATKRVITVIIGDVAVFTLVIVAIGVK